MVDRCTRRGRSSTYISLRKVRTACPDNKSAKMHFEGTAFPLSPKRMLCRLQGAILPTVDCVSPEGAKTPSNHNMRRRQNFLRIVLTPFLTKSTRCVSLVERPWSRRRPRSWHFTTSFVNRPTCTVCRQCTLAVLSQSHGSESDQSSSVMAPAGFESTWEPRVVSNNLLASNGIRTDLDGIRTVLDSSLVWL